MRFDVITIFPKSLESYFASSILKRSQEKCLVEIRMHDLRRWAKDKRRTVDDKPYGGGPGMLLKAEPLRDAVRSVKKRRGRVVLLSAKGKRFTQHDAKRLLRYPQVVFVCGRYEGVDERFAKHVADEELSIGDYVLSGGELAAAVVIEAISRLVPGVLGDKESIEDARYGVGVPQYTRPDKLLIRGKQRRVPKVLLSGDHKKIEAWRRAHIRKK